MDDNYVEVELCRKNESLTEKEAVFRIRIRLIRIQIQVFFLNPDPDPVPDPSTNKSQIFQRHSTILNFFFLSGKFRS